MGCPRHFALNLKRLVADPTRCLIPSQTERRRNVA